MHSPPAGLCDHCRHQQVVATTRGSRFSLCRRWKEDDRFARYPRLPVLRCPGFEEQPVELGGGAAVGDEDGTAADGASDDEETTA